MDFARPDAVEAFLHLTVYRELQECGVSGATVCLTKAGRYPHTLANCYGFYDVSRGLVLDPRASLFDLGGCAKVLAAIALLRVLREKGLGVTAEANSLLPPGLKIDTSRYGSVTLQHLLTHTSGLQRGSGGAGGGGETRPGTDGARGGGGECGSGVAGVADGGSPDGAVRRPNPFTAEVEQTTAASPSATPLAPPRPARDEAPETTARAPHEVGGLPAGTSIPAFLSGQEVYGARLPGVYRPQDLDYLLLGSILEHLTGEPYEQHVRRTLLEPLGVHLPAAQTQTKAQALHPGAGGDGLAGAGGSDPAPVAWSLVGAEEPPAGPWVYAVLTLQQQQQEASVSQPPSRSASEGLAVAGVAAGTGDESGDVHGGHGPAAAPGQRVLVRYTPSPLTPVGGLVLPACDIARLLPLFVPGVIGGGAADDSATAAPGHSGAIVGRSILSALCEIRMSDFLKDAGVAYGGLLALGFARCGGVVLSCESPPAPPTTREAVLTAQAAQAAADAHGGDTLAPPLGTSASGAEAATASGVNAGGTGDTGGGGGGGGGFGGSGGGPGSGGGVVVAQPGHPSLLVVAPECGFAMLVSCNTTGAEGGTFCRRIVSKLLEQFRPAELPRSAVRSWLAPLPPGRQDATAHLVAFPPACCVSPCVYFDGWPLLLPDFIKAHCMQAPGHGLRRSDPCELRVARLAPPAAAAILAGVPGDAPLALFGHGLGALWAFEVARRLEGVYQRRLLHLFVCACASPFSLAGRAPAGGPEEAAAVATADASGGGGEGGEGVARSDPPARYEPWRNLEGEGGEAKTHPQQQQQVAGGRELFELSDEAFVTAMRNHPRCPRHLRTNTKAIVEHLAVLRADVEAEMKYSFTPPAPSLCPAVQAALAAVQNRADEEARLAQGLLSCPITVLTPEEDEGLDHAMMAGWDQVTTGQVRFQSVPGDYHCLEDRKHRAQVCASITSALGRQLTVHVPWLAKLRPAGASGRWSGSSAGAGRPSSSARPGSAAGPAASPAPAPPLPPMYPRG